VIVYNYKDALLQPTKPIFRCCVYSNTKIRTYKTIIRSTLCCASEDSTFSKKVEMTLGSFERKIFVRMYGPIQDNTWWKIPYNNEI
jgi:hypothetical protein